MAKLFNSSVSCNKKYALISACDFDEGHTILTSIDLLSNDLSLINSVTVNSFPTTLAAADDHALTLIKDGSGWDAAVTLVGINWQTLAFESSKALPTNLFNYLMVINSTQDLIAVATFKDDGIKIVNANTLEEISRHLTHDTYYPKGMTFNADSTRFVYVILDQGGGKIISCEKTDHGFKNLLEFGSQQMKDDFNTTAMTSFYHNDVIACYRELDQHLIRYDENGKPLWERRIKSNDEGYIEKNKLDDEAYYTSISDHKHIMLTIGESIYIGSCSSVVVINVHTGEVEKEIAVQNCAFIFQIHEISKDSIFVVDILGDYSLIDITK